MPAQAILAILDRLSYAYPDKKLPKQTLQLYLQELADVPLPLLDQAVTHHIQTSPWFPRISDLRQAAHQLCGVADFATLPPARIDSLGLEAFELEQLFFKQVEFDPVAWENLAMRLERVDRLCRAQEVRAKAHNIQAWQLALQRGEEYPPQEVRRRYAAWEQRP